MPPAYLLFFHCLKLTAMYFFIQQAYVTQITVILTFIYCFVNKIKAAVDLIENRRRWQIFFTIQIIVIYLQG